VTEPQVERFVLQTHYPTLVRWYEGQGQKPPPVEALPQSGFVVPGAVAGFLYRTDSCVAVVEGLIANPEIDLAARRRGLDLLSHALIDEARKLGFKTMTASTTFDAVIQRALAFGFIRLPGSYTVLALAL
jgi:hypothetical protein